MSTEKPARLEFFPRVVERMADFVDEVNRWDVEKTRDVRTIFLKQTPLTLTNSVLGADTVIFSFVSPFDSPDEEAYNNTTPRLIGLEFLEDGSPMILEDDLVIMDREGVRQGTNGYHIHTAEDLPPEAIHIGFMHENEGYQRGRQIGIEKFGQGIVHFLNDSECTALLEALNRAEIDLDDQIEHIRT